MNSTYLLFLAVGSAYLIGSIPFAYLIVLGYKGVDIRSIGSGNVGATNAGRLLGFRFFLIVFALDLLKGFLPTLVLPGLVARWGGTRVEGLVVFVALATILGHNFPIYLKFQGGKGVATSLGAVCAIDPIAGGVATLAFLATMLATRMVSISSVLGASAFAVAYFARSRGHSWDGAHRATSLLILGLLGMLIVRHRKNFLRIAAGTEPRLNLRRSKTPPAGRIRGILLFGIASLGSVGVVMAMALRPTHVNCGPYSLETIARVETGHQRAGRLEFLDGGKLLAVACPRYNRVVLYRVTRSEGLEVVRDIALEGMPVAVRENHDGLYVLQRPTSDDRHVEAGWWETFDLQGLRVGQRFRVGFDPDDLVFSRDGRTAYVLLSGRAEGERNRPTPQIQALDLGDGSHPPLSLGRSEFDQPGDDPERIHLAEDGFSAEITLAGSEEVVTLNLRHLGNRIQRQRPTETSRKAHSEAPIAFEPDVIHLQRPWPCSIFLQPSESALTIQSEPKGAWAGTLPLRGTANLGGIRPAGLAYSHERGLLAVSNRQGGSVHLIAVRPRLASPPFHPPPSSE